jgi:hypothetical protein
MSALESKNPVKDALMETAKKVVIQELLVDWYDARSKLISEYSSDIGRDQELLNMKMDFYKGILEK